MKESFFLRTLPRGPQLAETAPANPQQIDKEIAREGTYQVGKSPAHSAARRNSLCCPVPVRHWRADLRNSVVAIERIGIWQLSLGCGVDSLQFYGGLGV